MAQQDVVIRLLLVEDQLEDAEQLISMLRNGGMAIRPQRPESAEDLDTLLAGQSIDMVLAQLDGKYLPFEQVTKCVEATGKDIPVLAAAGALDEATVMAAIAAGARDVALRSRAGHVRGCHRCAVDRVGGRVAADPRGSDVGAGREPVEAGAPVRALPE